MEARGTAKARAAEVMMVLCMAVVNDPVEPEKINDRRSTAPPGEGVTSGVLDGVIDGVPVPVEVRDVVEVSVVVDVGVPVPEGVGVPVEVSVVVDERDAVVEGVGVFEGVADADSM